MSTASTPRSTRSASPGNSPNMLTPGQKIKAMMAQFGSDSESDSETTRPKNTISKLDFGSKNTTTTETKLNQSNDSSDDSDDEDDIVQPKGRMAARMQGGERQSEEKEDSAFARLSKALRAEREQPYKPKLQKESPAPDLEAEAESSEDDLPTAAPRRKNNAAKRQSPDAEDRSRHSTPRARSYSPLFVSSPAADEQDQSDDADGENEKPAKGNARFLALVAQKRKEREEREKIEEEKKAARKAQMEKLNSDMVSGEESEAENPTSAHKLSQKARQPRKASKKALDEMRQETQRMSRNMQLAHQAQTKKKITKESFFARFNFGQPEAPVAEPAQANSSSTASSQQSSDAEVHKNRDTPHTSPVREPSGPEKPTDIATVQGQPESNGREATASTAGQPAVEKAPAPEELSAPKEPIVLPSHPAAKKETFKLTRRPVRVLMSRQEIAQHQLEDSDSDDLEVVTSAAKSRSIAAFENLPAQKMQESASMIRLKALAHLTSPTRKSPSMTSSDLSADLLYRARQQAAKERQERIEELRAKGVVIETAEERAAMEDDMEDLVEKARREADEIKRLERAARKNGEDPDDEEDDDDYELSGSEDGAQGSDDEDEDEDARSFNGNKGLIEQEADDGDESSDGESDALPADFEEQVPGTRRKRPTRVVSDDEDEEEAQQQVPSTPVRAPSHAAQSADRPRFLGMESPNMSMGLTQAFAGTLADDNDDTSQPASATIPFSLPDPGQPVPRLRHGDSEILVRDSQEQHDEPDFMANYHQNVTRVSESPAGPAFSQYSQLPDPTQDEGFVFSPFDPNKRFRGTPPVSTVDTVLVGPSQSPLVERKRKQLRRGRAADLSMVEEEEEEKSNDGGFEIDPNAFNVMKRAAKKPTVAYDKKNSKAKNVVDEAAEESEDEYAGLGGASDDSDDEENAYDKQMINDNSGETVDEKELAALNAVYDRNRDEKDVAKLLKDITTGALRRRRGADDDFDLDDSDDEHLARRREKQREFAKMRKALLADDKIGELADNPKKAAFFRALEDRDVEDDFELEFLEEKDSGSQNESQGMAAGEQQDGVANDSNKRKRPLEPSAVDATNRPPPNLRRTPASAMSKKPATLAEIRESLSFLTETPEYDSFHEDASVDEDDPTEGDDFNASGADEAAHSDDANSQPKEEFVKPSHPRRTRGPVVDRLALLRQASSNSATATTGSGNSKLAFQIGASNDGPIGFRPPKLLHRVSTGSSSSSNSSTTSNRVSKPAASGPKKGGAVNSYTAAREKEREIQLRVKQRNGSSNVAKLLNKHAGGGLGALAGKGQWD
ncbi:hypothetical protein N7486_000567 [Penicillium sp. IBT 16267x]|nr:hypothetical protein N7486_000567 [Penicillium sp. IBT 16267x]